MILGRFFQAIYRGTTRLDPAIWVAIIGVISSSGGWALNNWTQNEGLLKIDQGRIKRIQGRWDGHGFQEFNKEEAEQMKLNKVKDIKDTLTGGKIEFPAHLDLKVEGRRIFGELELTINKVSDDKHIDHEEKKFALTGSLADRDYIRLDYKTREEGTIEFGTILVMLDPAGKKLDGRFVSYGPVSRSIVGGSYNFNKVNGIP